MKLNIIYIIALLLIAPSLVSAQNKKEKDANKQEVIIISGLDEAQEICRKIGAKYDIPVINYEPVVAPKFWKHGLYTEVGFTQISLTNWAAGGSGSLALNTYINANSNYAKGNIFWDNRIQMAYGFLHSFDDGYRKSDDRLILDSKFGSRAIDKFYFSGIFNFKSQFAHGYTYSGTESTIVSRFLSPANLSFGAGIDYKPFTDNSLSINMSPITANLVIVSDTLLRTRYGNAADQPVRFALGAQINTKYEKQITKSFKLTTTLVLFSDYLNKPQNIRVNWDLDATYQITKYLKGTFRTYFIYDDKIMITDSDGHSAPRAQFKEQFGLNFTYTFGQYVK